MSEQKHTAGRVAVSPTPHEVNQVVTAIGMDNRDWLDKDTPPCVAVALIPHRLDNGKLPQSRKANARRLVACWNAAEEAGLSTEALEAGAVKKLVEALDKLVATLGVQADFWTGDPAKWGDLLDDLDLAEKLIAKAQG